MGLEGSKQEEEAAKMIQNKFRGLKIGGMKKKAATPAKDKEKEAAAEAKKPENGEGQFSVLTSLFCPSSCLVFLFITLRTILRFCFIFCLRFSV